jgi:6-phosphogluconate dehydrogenase
MGANMTTRLLRDGHRVVVYDLNEEAIQEAEEEGAEGAWALHKVVEKLEPPRAVWVMVPAGEPTESTIDELASLLTEGDIVIDGGNSNYKDSMRRAATLDEKGI